MYAVPATGDTIVHVPSYGGLSVDVLLLEVDEVEVVEYVDVVVDEEVVERVMVLDVELALVEVDELVVVLADELDELDEMVDVVVGLDVDVEVEDVVEVHCGRAFHAAFSTSKTNPSLWPTLALLQSLIAVAPENMPAMDVTAPVLKPPIGWLKAVAPENMAAMDVTAAVLKPPIGWSNARAKENM